MSKLIVYLGDNPECIEGFSASCSRSVQGALHIKPRKPMTVTDDEYQHIMASRADLKTKIRVVADKPDDKPEAKADGAAPVADAAKAAPVASGQAEKSEAKPETEVKAKEEVKGKFKK